MEEDGAVVEDEVEDLIAEEDEGGTEEVVLVIGMTMEAGEVAVDTEEAGMTMGEVEVEEATEEAEMTMELVEVEVDTGEEGTSMEEEEEGDTGVVEESQTTTMEEEEVGDSAVDLLSREGMIILNTNMLRCHSV